MKTLEFDNMHINKTYFFKNKGIFLFFELFFEIKKKSTIFNIRFISYKSKV